MLSPSWTPSSIFLVAIGEQSSTERVLQVMSKGMDASLASSASIQNGTCLRARVRHPAERWQNAQIKATIVSNLGFKSLRGL